MATVLFAIALVVLLAGSIMLIVRPLLRQPHDSSEELAAEARLADLEARKEAKYREIRDTELDQASGKLSEDDFRRQDAVLRREAVEILEQIDRLRAPG